MGDDASNSSTPIVYLRRSILRSHASIPFTVSSIPVAVGESQYLLTGLNDEVNDINGSIDFDLDVQNPVR